MLEYSRCSYAAQPCKNFNILGHTSILDPWDGREKYVLSSFALGGTGMIVFIDTLTGEGESFVLPVGNGAWGIVNWHDEKLIIGTCVDQAYLHVFDLQSRTWLETLESKGESYFWQMTIGSDDKVYGGTYPGCSLMQYDPVSHTLVNLGKVSDNEKNLYSRPVWGEVPGYILVAYGFDTKGLKAYHIDSGTYLEFGTPGAMVREITEDYICTVDNDELAFYDPRTFELLEDNGLSERVAKNWVTLPNGQRNPVIRLKQGRVAGFRGQDYFIIDAPACRDDHDKPLDIELKRIPVEAPETEIFTLVPDRLGNLWGASGFGQTIFRYNPATGESVNFSSVCNHGGEVYGMVFVGDRLFMASYVGGDHTVYDPSRPWDQLNNINPRTLRSVGPDLIRPEGRSVLGPDGGIWTGWSANYGVYGGGLSRIDPDTLEVDSWYDPIPQMAVAGVTADNKYVYFTTHGGASGLATRTDISCHLGVWEPGTGLIHQEILPAGKQAGYGVTAIDGRVALGVGK
ncbi:MAG: hypothetical protein E7E23_18510 [Paenibacillus sp.]|uniref:hypothetical protein n=1 Tax=Paenibacillus sp. TaxID=58172 RepID=UPI0029033315|nr:hypothetical protein [Paenibacillus sp.]MDU2242565.1 hypothetical protein [Paenibacillus sp.]